LEAAIAALASAQWGVMHLDQLTALGLSRRAVQQRASVGRLHRIHRGVYSIVPRELLTREGHWLAAVLAAGPGALLSHRSAAALHGLHPHGGAKIDVTIPTRNGRLRRGLRIHRSITLIERDATIETAIPCTTVARTLFDLADVLARRPLERAFDQAEIQRQLDLFAIQDQIERNRARKAAGIIRALLGDHYVGSTPTWSALEEAMLALVRRARVPEPEVNAWIVLPDGESPIRADFVWRPQRVVLETDGHRTHRTRQAFEYDRRRDQRLTRFEWRPVRATWRQIMRRPRELESTLVALLGQL
jgi:hypothetical protein